MYILYHHYTQVLSIVIVTSPRTPCVHYSTACTHSPPHLTKDVAHTQEEDHTEDGQDARHGHTKEHRQLVLADRSRWRERDVKTVVIGSSYTKPRHCQPT